MSDPLTNAYDVVLADLRRQLQCCDDAIAYIESLRQFTRPSCPIDHVITVAPELTTAPWKFS